MIYVHWDATPEDFERIESATGDDLATHRWDITRTGGDDAPQWRAFVGGREVGAYGYASLDDAAAALAPVWAWPGGYHAHYYPVDADGDMVGGPCCAHCARSAIVETATHVREHGMGTDGLDLAFHVEVNDGDLAYHGPVVCEWCNDVIEPHSCAECGDPIESGEGLYFSHGDGFGMHPRCMAGLVVKGKARHTGRGLYRVHDARLWATGNYEARVK